MNINCIFIIPDDYNKILQKDNVRNFFSKNQRNHLFFITSSKVFILKQMFTLKIGESKKINNVISIPYFLPWQRFAFIRILNEYINWLVVFSMLCLAKIIKLDLVFLFKPHEYYFLYNLFSDLSSYLVFPSRLPRNNFEMITLIETCRKIAIKAKDVFVFNSYAEKEMRVFNTNIIKVK